MTDADTLTLSQWLSPAYPVGAFAYSHGLEGAVSAGWVTDAAGLGDWLRDVLEIGTGRADGLFLAAAYHAALDKDALKQIDETARAFAAGKERLLEADQQGRAFAAVTQAVWGAELAGLCYPVALGAAAGQAELPLDLTLRMYLQAFASNLIAAGQRLLPVGQTEAQALLRSLTPLCADIAGGVEYGDLEKLSSAAYLGDIAAMQHETQYSRIFRT